MIKASSSLFHDSPNPSAPYDSAVSQKNTATQKITVSLPVEVVESLRQLANEQGITATAALRQAISTESFIREQLKNKAKILIQEPLGETKQVVFR